MGTRYVKPALLAVLAAAMMCGCEKEIEFNGKYSGEKLVLYACANPDTVLTADLFKSKFFLGYDTGHFYDMMEGAQVKAVVNGRSYSLTEDKEARKYVSDLVPGIGDRIRIEASLDGFASVSSEVVVPDRPEFSINSCSISDENELHFRVTLKDTPGRRDYYRIRIVKGSRMWNGLEEQSTLSRDVLFMSVAEDALIEQIEGEMDTYLEGCIDDSMLDGGSYTFDIWTYAYPEWDYYYTADHSEERRVSEIDCSLYGVEIDRVSESLFKYTRSCEAYNFSDDGIGFLFGEAVSISNNIDGGIGCFGALASRIIMWQKD